MTIQLNAVDILFTGHWTETQLNGHSTGSIYAVHIGFIETYDFSCDQVIAWHSKCCCCARESNRRQALCIN